MSPQGLAEKMDGKAVRWMISSAKENNSIITGSLIIEEEGQFFNRLFWVRPDGSFETYDKRHLFRLANEQNVYTGGTERKIVELKGWRVLLNICYDLRFPVWSRNQNNYDLMIYVANWPERRSIAWKTLLRARAIENQAYCIGVNRVGEDGNGVYHSGNSSIIHPSGEILLTQSNEPCILEASLSHSELTEFREKFPFHMDGDHFNIEL
jgi:predicted amidohydrolase